jgi:hypothetical protein
MRVTYSAVRIGLTVAGVIGLMTWPASLAMAKMTPDRQWVVIQGAHPAFAAEMTRIVDAAQRAHPHPYPG